MKRFALLLPILLPLASAVAAQDPPARDPLENPWMAKAGFLSNHPDWNHRLQGYEAYRQGRHLDALASFRRAGFFADKPSQAMIAEMYWNGIGVPRDRALAYAWMDLAAERGYTGFLRLRERYWHRLDAAERERALQEGQAIYAKFGDAVARPRQERQLRMALRNVVGSRTGFGGNGRTLVIDQSGNPVASIDHSEFYDRQFWEPKRYWDWQDRVQDDPRSGSATASDLLPSAEADTGEDAGSRDDASGDADDD